MNKRKVIWMMNKSEWDMKTPLRHLLNDNLYQNDRRDLIWLPRNHVIVSLDAILIFKFEFYLILMWSVLAYHSSCLDSLQFASQLNVEIGF